jgi:hypothetical protein
MVAGVATDCEEATMRNSNLLPVKAKGLVLLRSERSRGSRGRLETPTSRLLAEEPPFAPLGLPEATESRIPVSASPRKIEMTEGGASWPPRRLSLPAVAAEARRRPALRSTASMTAAMKRRKRAFEAGSLPGSRRLAPESVERAQFTCLPEPFTPSKGFSWRRAAMPWRSATLRIVSITSWFASAAMLALA